MFSRAFPFHLPISPLKTKAWRLSSAAPGHRCVPLALPDQWHLKANQHMSQVWYHFPWKYPWHHGFYHGSLDWFVGENLNRKPWFLPLDMGVSGFIFSLNQSNEWNTIEIPWNLMKNTSSMNITEPLVLEYSNIMEIRHILLWTYHEIPYFFISKYPLGIGRIGLQ